MVFVPLEVEYEDDKMVKLIIWDVDEDKLKTCTPTVLFNLIRNKEATSPFVKLIPGGFALLKKVWNESYTGRNDYINEYSYVVGVREAMADPSLVELAPKNGRDDEIMCCSIMRSDSGHPIFTKVVMRVSEMLRYCRDTGWMPINVDVNVDGGIIQVEINTGLFNNIYVNWDAETGGDEGIYWI